MIIDNADDEDIFLGFSAEASNPATRKAFLQKYIPERIQSAILITTRTKILGHALSKGYGLIEVPPLNREDSTILFRKHVFDVEVEDDNLDELIAEVEGLPLALAQAAAFITQMSETLETYLKLYKQSDDMRTRLLDSNFEAPGRDLEVPTAVTKTWIISFEHIRERHPEAGKLLSLMAMLYWEGIPRSLLQWEVADDLELTKALGTL